MSESNKREVVRIELAQYPSHPKWIRGTPDPKKVDEMRASLKALGQLVALVAIANPKSLIDGNMRAHCMRLEGWTHADAVLLDHEPTLQEVLEMQLGFEVRSNVPVTVRARTLAAIQEAGSYTVSALALRMGMTQSWCSQLLAVNKASDEVKAMLDAGKIDVDRVVMLNACTDPAIIAQAPTLGRDQLRQKVKSIGKPAVKTLSVKLPMPGGYVITVKGPPFGMDTLIELQQEGAKLVKKARAAGHDVSSVQRYLSRGK